MNGAIRHPSGGILPSSTMCESTRNVLTTTLSSREAVCMHDTIGRGDRDHAGAQRPLLAPMT
jgi:hypothetical protein